MVWDARPTVKGSALEVPPLGSGLTTATLAVPTAAISDAGIAAVSRVAEAYVVGRSAPFHSTFELATKFVPVRASVKSPPPTVAELGSRRASVGAGLVMVIVKSFVAVWLVL